MSTCLRLNCAKTERKHPDPTVIQDSAVASQTLNLAFKKEELCISINLVINRKRTCLDSPDMAVVTPLNNPGGPEGDTVTVDEQLLNTEY